MIVLINIIVMVRKMIVDFLKSLGYENVTLDLRGFRSGSSNEVLKETKE